MEHIYPHKGRKLMESGGVGFGGEDYGGRSGCGSGSIPYDCETSNYQQVASLRGIAYNSTASSTASSGSVSASSGGSAPAVVTKPLLPFNATSSSAAHTLFLSSSSGGMAGRANQRAAAAFTLAQREEFERQTMIFKYMMASIPVPPELLLPLARNTTNRNSLSSFSSSTDSEPWRCRRTDGKKWRCSRDVAPHQKYCERHSHKNRPRSRKPVESVNNAKLQQSARNSNSFNVSSTVPSQDSHIHYQTVQSQRDFSHYAASASPRCLEWFTRGEVIAIPNSDQEWQQQQHQQQAKDLYHLKQSHVPLSPYPGHEVAQELQARGGGDALNDQCSLLLGIPSLEGASNNSSSSNNSNNDNDDCRKTSGSLAKRGPVSLLSLAVYGGDGAGQEGEDEVQDERECDDKREELKPHWMSPGGPLAEALCLGNSSLSKPAPSRGQD